ncbi:MAG: hypothetical protein HQK89_14905 [Nitrospirae bacterium]|nr:hypothetical protein [Nitrospirota bacterium]
MNDWKDRLKDYKPNNNMGETVKHICVSCGNEFVPKEEHHKKCPGCFRKGNESVTQSNILQTDYLNGSYYDDKGCLKKEIFIKFADEVAKDLLDKNLKPQMTPTAVRAFYNRLKFIESQYKKNLDFRRVKEGLWELQSLAVSQEKRGVIPSPFYIFVKKNVECAEKDENGDIEFKGFIKHFFSVLAHFKEKTK